MATAKKKITSKKKATPKKAAPKKIAKAKVVKKKVIVKKTAPAKRTSAKKAVKRPAKSVAIKKAAPKAKTTRSNAPVVQNVYSPQVIEKKWQVKWEKDKLYRSVIDHSRAQALCADDAAVSQRRPAHRSLVFDDPAGYTCTLHADEGI